MSLAETNHGGLARVIIRTLDDDDNEALARELFRMTMGGLSRETAVKLVACLMNHSAYMAETVTEWLGVEGPVL